MTETFGERLQRLRKRADLTLDALAEEIGSTKSYVWELENKPNIRPSAELVYKLSKALDTTVGALLGEKEPEELPEADQVFFRNYQKLKPPTKARLSKIMDILAEEDDGKGRGK
jgi:transcriptional regulator with XRE-family HTH domain